MSVYSLEELAMPALDALDRTRTVIIITVSPLEEHGPHLPLGVDAFTARHFAAEIARGLVAAREGWSVVLTPTLFLGSGTLEATGTVTVRQRVVRDALVDYGEAFARSGFRHLLVANGHGGPGHLTALDEASAIVSRRHGVTMASLSGHLVWQFRSGRFLEQVEARLGRSLTDDERRAFAEDSHAGWWETSMMLLLRPDLVHEDHRTLPPATYSPARRLVRNYPLKGGGRGYVGHPALANTAFAKATTEVLVTHALTLIDGLLEGTTVPAAHRSPFYAMPFFRTNFWPAVAVAGAALAALAWLPRRGGQKP